MTLTLYGIPTCGTVRKARSWLDERGVTYDWVDFRQTPPEPARVARWVEALGAKALRNTSGGSYRALGPEKQGWSESQWTSAFQQDAMLIKRPVLEIDGAPASVGFKPEAFADLVG
ncbi:MAG: Spx/MgsR family RNA polymerase-binding regulatory protein [Alphaproteobacteria bacterium]|nr:Spx/MgsR family RNA polymerase-binding regulatory protein [Alphaproteobacteria bacterium]